VGNDHWSGSGFKPNFKKILPFGFSLSAEACRIFAFFVLAKAALQKLHIHDIRSWQLISRSSSFDTPSEGRGNLDSLRSGFDTGSKASGSLRKEAAAHSRLVRS
jgi:hypothetical protein